MKYKGIILALLVTFLKVNGFGEITLAKEALIKKDTFTAIKELKSTINESTQPKEQLEAYTLLLDLYFNAKQRLSYITTLERASMQENEVDLLTLQRGVEFAFFLKDYKQALSFSRRINTINTNNPGNMNSMGLALFYLKKYKASEAAFQIAISQDPNNYLYLSNVARVLALIGNKERSKSYYRRALEINPRFARAKRELAALIQPPLAVTPIQTLPREGIESSPLNTPQPVKSSSPPPLPERTTLNTASGKENPLISPQTPLAKLNKEEPNLGIDQQTTESYNE